MTCPDCNGTGQYVGLNSVEPCPTCCGKPVHLLCETCWMPVPLDKMHSACQCRSCAIKPVADQSEPNLIDKINEAAEQHGKRTALDGIVYAQNPSFYDKLKVSLSDEARDAAPIAETMRRVLKLDYLGGTAF